MSATEIRGRAHDLCIIDEVEILEFYRSGSKVKDLAESFEYRLYFIKKCLANEPEFAAKGYIYRPLAKKQT